MNAKRMKDMPADNRPYEKFKALGPSALTDAELLAIIIRTGVAGHKSIDLAQQVLSMSKAEEGILGILYLTMEELMILKGIGKVKATQIKCIAELSRRISKSNAAMGLCFNDPESVAMYYMEDLRHNDREKVIAVMLNTKNKFISDYVISTGTVNATLLSPREIFIEAIKNRAVYIILLHNHPSGDPTPSKEDMINTKRIKEAGELIGISLIDHIIIGDNRFISLRQQKII